jgi:hypothetical protein
MLLPGTIAVEVLDGTLVCLSDPLVALSGSLTPLRAAFAFPPAPYGAPATSRKRKRWQDEGRGQEGEVKRQKSDAVPLPTPSASGEALPVADAKVESAELVSSDAAVLAADAAQQPPADETITRVMSKSLELVRSTCTFAQTLAAWHADFQRTSQQPKPAEPLNWIGLLQTFKATLAFQLHAEEGSEPAPAALTLSDAETQLLDVSELLGQMVSNVSKTLVVRLSVAGQIHLVPPLCSFLISDMSNLDPLRKYGNEMSSMFSNLPAPADC